MKIVIDVDRLLTEGRITTEEHERLKALAIQETGALAFSILIGFGVVATASGVLALFPTGPTAIFLGSLLSVAGVCLSATHTKEWGLLGSMLLLIGAISAGGGILFLTEEGFGGYLLVTLLCAAGSVLAKSGILAALAVLSLSSALGAMTAYGHATYMLAIRQPSMTVLLFSLLALGAYQMSKALSAEYQRLAIIAARTSLLVVNFGFWIGSLWGDSFLHQKSDWNFRSGVVVPDWVFVVGWAVGLLATGLWAANANKRWVVNLMAVFGAIHFYTQYFERLGASPGSLLVAGLAALGIALAAVRYNKSALAAATDDVSPPNQSQPPPSAS